MDRVSRLEQEIVDLKDVIESKDREVRRAKREGERAKKEVDRLKEELTIYSGEQQSTSVT